MLGINTVHSNLVKQVRTLVGDQLSDIVDPVSTDSFKAVIKDSSVMFQDDAITIPEYPFIVVDLTTAGKRFLTAKALTEDDTVYITTLREPKFKISCYGGASSEILDKLALLLEYDATRNVFDDALNTSTDQIKSNSSVRVQYLSEPVEKPTFIETSFINSAELEIKLGIESHFEIPNSSTIEEVSGTLFIKNYPDDPNPIEVAIHAP